MRRLLGVAVVLGVLAGSGRFGEPTPRANADAGLTAAASPHTAASLVDLGGWSPMTFPVLDSDVYPYLPLAALDVEDGVLTLGYLCASPEALLQGMGYGDGCTPATPAAALRRHDGTWEEMMLPPSLSTTPVMRIELVPNAEKAIAVLHPLRGEDVLLHLVDGAWRELARLPQARAQARFCTTATHLYQLEEQIRAAEGAHDAGGFPSDTVSTYAVSRYDLRNGEREALPLPVPESDVEMTVRLRCNDDTPIVNVESWGGPRGTYTLGAEGWAAVEGTR